MAGSQLPSGTVIFLFTDVESSTRLMDDLGEEAYVDALTKHRRSCGTLSQRAAASRSTRKATPSCTPSATPLTPSRRSRSGQQALESGPVRVRMGLHTRRPQLSSAALCVSQRASETRRPFLCACWDQPRSPCNEAKKARVARLLGAADALREEMGYALWGLEPKQRARIAVALRGNEPELVAAQSEGRALALDDAVA
jgi:hypothetical protein